MDSKTLNYLKNRISYVDPNEAYNKLREYGAKYQGASDSYFDEFNRLSTWADPYKIDRTDPISMFKDDIKQFDAENKDEDTITDKLTGKTYTRAEIKNLTMNNYLKDVEESIKGKSNPLYDIGKTATTIGYGMAEGMGQVGLAKIGANAISEATGTPKTENYSAELADSIGASEDSTARRIGNVAGSVVQGMTLGALGVPPAATYGIQSGLRAYGNTNDVGDIAVETGLGAVYGTLFNGISGALKTASAKAITGVGNAIYTSLLQNLGINLATSTAGAYSANAITGTVRNVYNKIRGREVDWTQPLFSKDAVINALVSGTISGTIGTINDIRSAPAQARADTQNALRSLDNLKRQMAESARTGDVRGYNQAYIKGQQIIYALSKLKYLGFKLNSEELSNLANAWSDTRSMINLTYALDGGVATPTTPTSGYMPMPSMPTTTTGGNTPIVYTPPTNQSSSIVPTVSNTQPNTNIVGNDLYEAILGQLDENKINQEEFNIIDKGLKDVGGADMDWADYSNEETRNQAISKVFDEFVNSDEGKKFIAEYKEQPQPSTTTTTPQNNTEPITPRTPGLTYQTASGKKVPYATSKQDYGSEPENGKIRLYTNTPFENIDSILEQGLKANAGDNRPFKEYEGNAIWFETRPDQRGYGGTTIAVELGKDDKMLDKVNDTQYMYYKDVSPNNIKFIDRPLFDETRTSDLPNLISQYGKDKVLDVVHKASLGMDKYVTDAEFDQIVNAIDNNNQLRDSQTKGFDESISENINKYNIENSEQGSFSMPKNLPEELPTTRRRFLKDFEYVGYVNVNGAKVESTEDLADIAQIFRDPLFETFRVIYTKGNEIVGQTALTTYSARRVGTGYMNKLAGEINSYAEPDAFDADGFYLIHNHPDGHVEASNGDKEVTKSLVRFTNISYKGHVIIDHNKYTVIDRNGNASENIPLKKNTFNNIEKNFSTEGWAGLKIRNDNDIAKLSSYVKNGKDLSTLILTTPHNEVQILQSLDNSFLKGNPTKAKKYVQDLAKKNGATKALVATQDEETYIASFRDFPTISVLYEPKEDGSLNIIKANNTRQTELFREPRNGAKNIAPAYWEQKAGPKVTNEQIVQSKQEPQEVEPKKEKKAVPKKNAEPKNKLTKKQSGVEPSLEKANKDIAKLEKANQELRDKLAKQQEKSKEKLAKKDKELDDLKQSKKDALRKKTEQANKREEKQKEERSLKRLEPEKRLPKLVNKAKAQQQEYTESEFPEVSEKFENEFGKTIRDIISTLSNQKIMRKLPDKLRELITNYKNETYLKANWKTFDKYLKEAIADKQLRDIINNSNTPVSDRLLSLIQEHNQAPIVIQTAAEMKKELDDLIELVNAVKQSLEFAKADQELEKTREAIKMELDPIIEKNLKTHNARSETVDEILNFFDKTGREISTAFMFFPTRIQATMNGNPDSNMNILWKNIERGSETEMRLDVEKSRLFDKFFENPNSRNFKLKGELAKDFEENPKWEETNTPVGRATRLMMMSIYGMTMNKDNLMHITPVLLGTTEDGEGIYSKPGGLIVPEERAYKRGDLSTAYANGKTVKLTQEDIDKIVNMLTPIEKDLVKTCVQDVADFIAKEGNPVSMDLTGRELFHPNYLRILVSDDALDPEMIDPAQTDQMSTYLSTMDTGLEGRMGRGGSLQGRTHKSTRPIYLEDLWRATNSSINGAIKYISYAEALYDNDLILKTKFPNTYKKVGEITEAEAKKKTFGAKRYIEVDELPKNGNGTYIIDNGNGYDVYEVDTFGKTMGSLIAATGDDKFMKYYKDYIQTLLYGVGSTNAIDQAVGRLAGMRAKVVLNANINVALSQQLSRPLIMQFLEHPTKSFAKGFADKSSIYKLAEEYLKNVGGVDTTGLAKREMFNKFLEYATYMNSYRGLGKYSQDVEFLKDQKKGLGKIDLGWFMTMNDRSAVDFTFRVLIEDILNGRKEFTEEDMKELQNRAWQVARSNPSYLRAYKTPLQMAKSSTVRALSQFQTVMFLGYNNYLYASMAENYYKNNGGGNKAKEWAKKKRISGAGLIIASIAGAIIYETLSTMLGREGTKDLPERILKSTISKTLSYTIIGDELFQWFMGEGYDLSTNDLGYANQLKNTLTYFGKIWSSEDSKKPSAAINFTKSVGSMMGLPMNSLENIFTLVGNITDSDLGKAYKTIKNPSALKKWIDKQEQLNGTSMATYYDIYQATRENTLKEKYGYGAENTKEYAIKRAIADVLGYPKKNLTKKQESEISRYYQIFK